MSRRRIIDQYGEDCRIRQVRRAADGESWLFVVDTGSTERPTRLLGAIGRNGLLTEQSAMDLLRPERLVFLYERLMLVAFALAGRAQRALLLGLGGGAMCRHLMAYLPDCALAIVERDRAVIETARRHFHVAHAIEHADAQEVVADAQEVYDVILADLYDGRGAAMLEAGFWQDCARALAPGGCLAVNWAAFVENRIARAEAAVIAGIFGSSASLGPRELSENVIQLARKGTRIHAAALAARWRRFAEDHALPREDRDVLKRCTIRAGFPR